MKKIHFFLAVVLLLGLPVFLYAFSMRNLSVVSEPKAWADFGTYIGGVLGPIVGLINLYVLLHIAIVVNGYQQTQLATKRLSIEILNEYNSEKMHDSRIKIDEMINDIKNGRQLLSLSAQERKPDEYTRHCFIIYNFFEKWAALSQTKNLDEDVLIAAMSSRVRWWKDKFFDLLLAAEDDGDFIGGLQLIDEHVLGRFGCGKFCAQQTN